MTKGKQTGVQVIDFSKAFDMVSLSLLILKLDYYGMRGKTNDRWNKALLLKRLQTIVLEREIYHHINVEFGVTQGISP